MTGIEKRMDMDQFNEELKLFLYEQNHPYKCGEYGEVKLDYVEMVLNRLSSKFLSSNKCLEFLFDGESCWVKTECQKCGHKICEEFDLEYILKVFKRVWRTGVI
jgi:hypothetical protein